MELGKYGGCQNSEISEPMDIKLGTDDWAYVGDITHMPKMKAITQVGEYGHMRELSLSRGLYFPFSDPKFCSRPESKAQNRFRSSDAPNFPPSPYA